MNEADTRAQYIDPQLKAQGWGVVEDSRILREHRITDGRIQSSGARARPEVADYVLVYKNQKIAIVEAKPFDSAVGEGVAQAKSCAQKLHIDYCYAANGKEIYEMSLQSGQEGLIANFPTPNELWQRIFADWNDWQNKFTKVANQGEEGKRYYQEIAINRVMRAIAQEKKRILLAMATGSGKTIIAFQIAWKLFQTRWNLQRDGKRRPRILFLADRNILANQAFNVFSNFFEADALVRIDPPKIRKRGSVPTSGSVYFTIFQTLMSGDNSPYFDDYPPDFFDLVIVDECHRGGADNESSWRDILEHFSPAVQLGLTATPKRQDNVDTYRYFGNPVYTYSLKEGINDGFLTPYKIKQIKTTIDDYVYTADDEVLSGEVEEGRRYVENDFNKNIIIKEREKKRVDLFLRKDIGINQEEKTLVFCADQAHALLVRDLINQRKTKSSNPNYCVRVTADEGESGEQFLREFQDNEKTIPTILTTSRKLSTGVDARNIRNIILMRPIKSMIEFKQIIGRGTRIFDNKAFFTIYDFVDACQLFFDPEWDGEPLESSLEDFTAKDADAQIHQETAIDSNVSSIEMDDEQSKPKKEILTIRLADGKERQIQHTTKSLFLSETGEPLSVIQFIEHLYGTLPEFFKSEEELRELWSRPATRQALLKKLAEKGFGKEELLTIQQMCDAQHCDLFDVLRYIAYATPSVSREQRVKQAKTNILAGLNEREKEFIDFVLGKYKKSGVEELAEEKLPHLLDLKYRSLPDAKQLLGDLEHVKLTFLDFQKNLYAADIQQMAS